MRALLWPTIVTAFGLALLLTLGTWQLERLAWKSSLTAKRDAHLAAPVFDVTPDSQPTEPLEFRRVTVRGTYLHDREFHLLARTYKGSAGIHLVTPLVGADPAADAPVILVNRGWVPNEFSDPATRPGSQVTGIVTVEGIARAMPRRRGWFAPKNEPSRNVWHSVDIGQISAALGRPVAAFIVEAGPAPNAGGIPLGGQTRLSLRNDHLGYAVTWYTLAVALAAIYVFFVGRVLKRSPAAGTE